MGCVGIYVDENNDIILREDGLIKYSENTHEKILNYINYKYKDNRLYLQFDVESISEQHSYEQMFGLLNYLSEPDHKLNVKTDNFVVNFNCFKYYDQSIYNFIVNNSVKYISIHSSGYILFSDIYNCDSITCLILCFYDAVYEDICLLSDVLSGNTTIIVLKILSYCILPNYKEIFKNIIDTTYINNLEYTYESGYYQIGINDIPLDQRHVPIKSNTKSAAKKYLGP